MKRIFLLAQVLLWMAYLPAPAQQLITLRECYDLASKSSPITSEILVYDQIRQQKDKNLSKGWLPTIDANGSFIYNSSVIDLTEAMGSLPVPGISDLISPMPHEQYKMTLEINQVIYDGGTIREAKSLEMAEFRAQEKQTEAELYKLKNQVNGYYFNILLLEKQEELLKTYRDLIQKRMTSIEAAIRNGVMLPTEQDVLLSEKINLEQQLAENSVQMGALQKVLSDITGSTIDTTVRLVLPMAETSKIPPLTRPELQIFELRKGQLDASIKLRESQRRPKVFGFATLGYGNPPGNNFFKDEFASFAIVGAGIRWNIYDWDKTSGEIQVIDYQKSLADIRKADLSAQLNRLLETKMSEIKNLEARLETDSDLIEIRKRITQAAGSRFENGVITATEFMHELNAEKQAVINQEINRVRLALSKVEYLNISGKEIN
jgi:outer membrane protein TolC